MSSLGESAARRELLAADLDRLDDHAVRERHTERKRLQRKLADVTRRQDAILLQVEDGDPNDPFTKGLRGKLQPIGYRTERHPLRHRRPRRHGPR